MSHPTFEAPGPGSWELDDSHFSGAMPRYDRDRYADSFQRGMRDGFEHAGLPMDSLALRFVNGYAYLQMQPLIGSAAATRLPPKPLFKLVSALHPAMRKRVRRAGEALDGRFWQDDVRRWDDEYKPGFQARFTELRADRLARMDDAALVSHLAACSQVTYEALRYHMFLNAAAYYPTGDFLVQVSTWTGRSPGELIPVVIGTSPMADGDGSLDRLVEALRADPDARAALEDGAAEEGLDRLRERGDELGRAAAAWLDEVAVRMLSSVTLTDRIGAEAPDLLRRQLLQALDGSRRARPDLGDPSGAVREQIPAEHRAEFDELLEAARLTYRLRDERVHVLDNQALGLLRRALLEVGRRLVELGRLHQADHAVDLDHDEVEAALLRGEGPDAAQVARRVRDRLALTIDKAPRVLGPPPMPPPPADWLPGATRRLVEGVMTYVEAMEEEVEQGSEGEVIEGLAASVGQAEGPARVVRTPEDFALVEPGDVLVARATTPTYNVLLPLLGGIVTDRGGRLCHAAIVSREYGIPCVVGTRVATDRIPDGARVRIDGDSGQVVVLP